MANETMSFRPTFENPFFSDDFHFSDLINIIKPETTSSQHQAHSVSSSEPEPEPEPEPETVSKRVSVKNPPTGKITKRKSRASKRSPTTFIAADPENFRQMVQQVTGIRFEPGQVPSCSVVKPEPQRAAVGGVNRIPAGCLLPTLDTSAFLLDHHQEVVGPATVVAGHGPLGFGPPGVVPDVGRAGFEFDGFPSFPTLESWKVM